MNKVLSWTAATAMALTGAQAAQAADDVTLQLQWVTQARLT